MSILCSHAPPGGGAAEAQGLRYVLILQETGLLVGGPTGQPQVGCVVFFGSMAHWKWEQIGSIELYRFNRRHEVPAGNAVMPLDVLGRTRATLTEPASTSPWPKGLGNLVKLCRAGDRALQLLLFNEESLVSTSHQLVLITSLPFVHTARRYYRLNGSVRPSDWPREVGNDHPGPESCPNSVI